MAAEWPDASSVSLSLPTEWTASIELAQVGMLYRLVHFIAMRGVNTYSPADPDPRLPNDEGQLMRIAGCSKREWRDFSVMMPKFFVASEAGWRLKRDGVVRISRPSTRDAISVAVKSVVMSRDGQRCVYCGDISGPFHLDHLYPVSRGGSNEAANIVLACAPCNLAKGGLTLAEWVGR